MQQDIQHSWNYEITATSEHCSFCKRQCNGHATCCRLHKPWLAGSRAGDDEGLGAGNPSCMDKSGSWLSSPALYSQDLHVVPRPTTHIRTNIHMHMRMHMHMHTQMHIHAQ
jgi:hypothetical protein